jgi:ubiquinone/menaquinone biosynthesis C-methylase UbiE
MLVSPLTDALREKQDWYLQENSAHPPPDRHHYAHRRARSAIAWALRQLGYTKDSLILSVGTGTGVEIEYIESTSQQIFGVDLSLSALKQFREMHPYPVFQANARELPFRDDSFDGLIVSETLHHIAGYDDLIPYLREFRRVLAKEGWLIAVEPNSWYPVQWLLGPINKVMQRVRPGWRGLVPHERPLSPHFLVRQFKRAGFTGSTYFSTTFVHNRFPLRLSQLISRWEDNFRFGYPLKLLGWCVCIRPEASRCQ